MRTYKLRTRRSYHDTMTTAEPMSGAGFNMEDETRRTELRWAEIQHAIQLSLNYFKRYPVAIEHAKNVISFVKARALTNYKRIGGDEADYMLTLCVHSIPQETFSECIGRATASSSLVEFDPIKTSDTVAGNVAGGGGGSQLHY